LRHGYIVAEWGDPKRVDMTFSVTKNIPHDRCRPSLAARSDHDVNDYAGDYMPPGVDLFEHRTIRRSSGTTFCGRPVTGRNTLGQAGWGDRPEGDKPATLAETGSCGSRALITKYNDVRINVLALAVLNVWRRPLQDVLREEVMEPIDASSTWRWYGYDNSWVEIDGQRIQSVHGWRPLGGGMFINAYDMARFGYLFLRDGKWKGRKSSRRWIQMARTPGPANANYGFAILVLNTAREAAFARCVGWQTSFAKP